MPRLIFSTIASLDGYTADTEGRFDWSAPDAEVHSFVNDRLRPMSTFLYGRRMYETMRVWQDLPGADDGPVIADFAQVWQGAQKVVYSSTLTEPATPRTRIVPRFDPGEVRALVDASTGDVSIGGPTLAAEAFRAGLVDEVELYLVPVSVGGGTPALPLDTRLPLELLEERRFSAGTVWLRYRVTAAGA
ncbi:MAG TPA: dihydrofolate reductase family protein [Leifsonia sp.]|jgi:dihydrofolate reductase